MSGRVLVVEDDVLNSMFICAALEANGFAVRPVVDGAQALAAAREFRPDLITMDINLPRVSGLTLIRKLTADPAFADTPILAITAHVGKGEEHQIRDAGATDYLAKPLSLKPFLGAVERLLAAKVVHH